MADNYREKVMKEALVVFNKIVSSKCVHKSGTKSWSALQSKKAIDDVGAVSIALQLAGVLPKGKTIGNKASVSGNGLKKNTVSASTSGSSNVVNATNKWVGKTYSKLPETYKKAGTVFVYNDTIAICGGDGSIYCCNAKKGKTYTSMSMIKQTSGYCFTQPILTAISPKEGSKTVQSSLDTGNNSNKKNDKKKTTSNGSDLYNGSIGNIFLDENGKLKDTVYTKSVNTDLETSTGSPMDASTRLFGAPHQFIDTADPRIGTSGNLGRCYAERLILEAPIICIKPGKPRFLPGASNDDRDAMKNALVKAASGSSNEEVKDTINSLSTSDADDIFVYYDLDDAYVDMMEKVNVMCMIMANFLGIANKKVPWHKSATFGNYNWMYYTFKNIYGDITFNNPNSGGGLGVFIKNTMDKASKALTKDSSWLRFYVDANASFSESASNSTTESMLESFTTKMESLAKELQTVGAMTGWQDMDGLVEKSAATVDSFISGVATIGGPFATLLRRLSGNAAQIINGGNFLIPEMWSSSEYTKNYNFSITLSTPYGNVMSWFLNVGVPLCHILGFCLPQQLTANTYKSPYLVKCYSPGWFNCNYGIIDSVNIEKGEDNSWNIAGFPNEIKVSLSVKDLYSTLSIPEHPTTNIGVFLNTGMLEFLAVNCGFDMVNQAMDSKLSIWTALLSNRITGTYTSVPYRVQHGFKQKIQKLWKLF